jgi:hypothetical protein
MTLKLVLTQQELCSSRVLFNLLQRPKRNLGCAILVSAIDDYRSMDEQAHASAAHFLYPTSPEYREHYDWVVAMARGANPAWLRSALDKAREVWDKERAQRKLRARLDSTLRKIESHTPATAVVDSGSGAADARHLSHVMEAPSMPGALGRFQEVR